MQGFLPASVQPLTSQHQGLKPPSQQGESPADVSVLGKQRCLQPRHWELFGGSAEMLRERHGAELGAAAGFRAYGGRGHSGNRQSGATTTPYGVCVEQEVQAQPHSWAEACWFLF